MPLTNDPEVVKGRADARRAFREDPTIGGLVIQYRGSDTTGRGSGWMAFVRDRSGALYLGHYDTIRDANAAIAELERR